MIDCDHATCIHQLGRSNGKLPDRTTAEYRYGMARLDIGEIGTEVTGREDIGHQDGLLIRYIVRQLDEIDVRKGNAGFFRLKTIKGACRLWATIKSCARRWAN